MYPKRKDLFDAWYKAMVAGATVDKPNYGKTTSSRARTNLKKRKRLARRLRKKRKVKDA